MRVRPTPCAPYTSAELGMLREAYGSGRELCCGDADCAGCIIRRLLVTIADGPNGDAYSTWPIRPKPQ